MPLRADSAQRGNQVRRVDSARRDARVPGHVIVATPPVFVSGPMAGSITDEGAVFTANIGEAGDALILWDTVSRSAVGDYANATATSAIGADGAATVTIASGLPVATTIFWRMRIRNVALDSTFSTERSFSTLADPLGSGDMPGITIGTLVAHPMRHKIGLWADLTEADVASNWVVRCTTEFKRTADSTWREFVVPTWPNRASSGSYVPYTVAVGFIDNLAGSLAGTSYDIRVTFYDKLGNSVQKTVSATTRPIVDLTPTNLVPTLFVRTSGSDANNGLTATTAFATLGKAFQVANASNQAEVIGVAHGYYHRPDLADAIDQANDHPVTVVAITDSDTPTVSPAVNTSTRLPVAETAPRTVVYGAYVFPTGSETEDTALGRYAASWTSVDVPGQGYPANYADNTTPAVTPTYQMWMMDFGASDALMTHTNSAAYVVVADYANYATAKLARPRRIHRWLKDRTHLTSTTYFADNTMRTIGGAAETIHTNRSWNEGYWQDFETTEATDGKVWLRMPTGVDPNDCLIWFASDFGTLDNVGNEGTAAVGYSPDIRICGLELRVFATGFHFQSTGTSPTGPRATRMIIDHCLFTQCGRGLILSGGESGSSMAAANVRPIEHPLIWRNHFRDTTLYSVEGEATVRQTPWLAIKEKILTASGLAYSASNATHQKLLGQAETTGFRMRGYVYYPEIAENRWSGPFNGWSTRLISISGTFSPLARQMGMFLDSWGGHYEFIGDNPEEPEDWFFGMSLHHNTMRYCATAHSLADPADGGPIAIYAESYFRIGAWGLTTWDTLGLNLDTGATGTQEKITSSTNPLTGLYYFNNTGYHDFFNDLEASDVFATMPQYHLYLRNNLLAGLGRLVNTASNGTTIDADRNFYVSRGKKNWTETWATSPPTLEPNMRCYRLNGTNYNSKLTTGSRSIAALRTALSSGSLPTAWQARKHWFSGWGTEASTNVDQTDGTQYPLIEGDTRDASFSSPNPWTFVTSQFADVSVTDGNDPEDVTLAIGSHLRGRGVVIPGFERAGTDFDNSAGTGAPNMGHTGVALHTN